jgi:histidine triad (HIT) family protein
MEGCIFCSIVGGSADAAIVYRDDLVVAFMDIHPVNPGHVLVIPARHATGLLDLPEETGARIFRVAQRVSAAIRASGLRCDGINLILADGRAAMQEIPHVHLHVVPRFVGDGIGVRFLGRGGSRASRAELEKNASLIRAKLAAGATADRGGAR